MDLSQYLEMFFEESKEHLQAINENLVGLEQSGTNLDLLNAIFRSAHTLKGMSATMGFTKMARLTHEMENALDLLRTSKLSVTEQVMDALFSCVDRLEQMLGVIGTVGADDTVEIEEQVSSLARIADSLEPSPATLAETESFAINSYETSVIEQSLSLGFSAFHLEVALADSCILKSARVYMIMTELENCGEILRTVPPIEDLEAERFEGSFSVLLLSQSAGTDLESSIMKISEVEKCQVRLVHSVAEPLVAAAAEVADVVEAAEAAEAAVQPEASSIGQPELPLVKPSEQERKVIAGKSVRVDIERLDTLMNLFSELVVNRTRLERIARESKHPDLVDTVEQMGRISADLQNLVMKIRMVPVETVFNRFPRMVRDLARKLGKKVDFVITGAETELDRIVIDEIGDPLVHMLRNSLDHALETPEERLAAGKEASGRLELTAYHAGNHVYIEVRDDGRGIDRNKVLKRAVGRKLIEEATADLLSDQEVFRLLFRSGFSTAEQVSDLSGRGVGLDVVKNKIESIGGSVVVDSVVGKGTRFTIRLPLTLSIMQALLVRTGDETFAIPVSSVIETASLETAEVRMVHKQQMMDFRGKVIPLLNLAQLFKIEKSSAAALAARYIVVVRKGDQLAGIAVDSLLGQQEVVLKPLGKYLSAGVFAISGATILGDGEVALIMDCNAFFR